MLVWYTANDGGGGDDGDDEIIKIQVRWWDIWVGDGNGDGEFPPA